MMLGAFGGGVDAVSLNGIRNANQILVEHGNQRGVVLCGESGKDLLEGVDVVGAVVGREGDTG